MNDENINVLPSYITRKRKKITVEEYDRYLKTVKGGRFCRVGEWKGYSKSILHRCLDKECSREWSPSPSQVIENDDYYCPSCVLHHRNNMDRFLTERLEWTADVPNTFYVYHLIDPKTKEKAVKFGRTQHTNPNKRYSLSERKKYNMKLLFSLRGKLRTMTKIENWWKDEAKSIGLFLQFSEKDFHGQTEVVKNEETSILRFIEESKKIASSDQI